MRSMMGAVSALVIAAAVAVGLAPVAEAQTGTVPSTCWASLGKTETSGSNVRGVATVGCNDQRWGVYGKITLYEVRNGKTRTVATDTCTAGPVASCTARTRWVKKASGARYYASSFVQAN